MLLVSKNQFQKRIKRAAIAYACFVLLVLLWPLLPFLNDLERTAIDFRYKYFNRDTQASDQVIIIDIDEQSMKLLGPTLGRWPWGRKVYKELIEFLSVGEPAGIFFDILFTEAQQSSDDDELLSQMSELVPGVSHAVLFLKDPASEIKTQFNPMPLDFSGRFGLNLQGRMDITKKFMTSRDYLLPAPPYLKRTRNIHIVSTEADSDGVYRKMPLIFPYEDKWYPSMTLQALMQLKQSREIRMENSQLLLGTQMSIPLDSRGNLGVHYYRASSKIELDRNPKIVGFGEVMDSAVRMLNGDVSDPSELKFNPLQIKGKILLVGGSAAGLQDLKLTPVSSSFPGVLLHATAISNILKSDYLKPIPPWFTIVLALLTPLLIYISLFFVENILIKILFPVFWMGGLAFFGIYLFQSQNALLELARPMVLGLATVFDGLLYSILIERKDKKKLKDTLSKYLPPSMANEIIHSGYDPQAEVGSRSELSILFSDIRGFTTLSENVNPERLVHVLNEYLGNMTNIVFEHLGTLDKFIGDAVMAFWGAPVHVPDHASKAAFCAVHMIDTLRSLNQRWKLEGWAPFQIGVGINTGEVIVGNIGSEKRLDYTVIGDNVNLASRLEGLTKQYQLEILIGNRTFELIQDHMICRPIDWVKAKGKKQFIKVYQPLCNKNSPEVGSCLELCERFTDALSEYQKGSFEASLRKFKEIHLWRGGEDGPTQVFMERCQEMIEEKPSEWDGVFIAKSK